MSAFVKEFTISTQNHTEVCDITQEINEIVADSGVENGLCLVFTPHATAAIAANENDDPNIGTDLQKALTDAIPDHAGWLHDRVDNNAAAHIKATIVGPSETFPVIDGRLLLGTWQNVFYCEFDGPRSTRRVVVSVQ